MGHINHYQGGGQKQGKHDHGGDPASGYWCLRYRGVLVGIRRVMAIRSVRGITLVKGQRVAAFGQLDPHRVFRAFAGIILNQLGTETAGLDAHHGVHGRIKVRGPPELFGRNLVLL